MRSARLVSAHGSGLRVLLTESVDLWHRGKLGKVISTINDLEVATGSVVLVLATQCALGLHTCGPAPDPVNREVLADLCIGWDEHIALAPLLKLRGWLAGVVITIAHLSVDRERRLVQLVASAIVVVLSRHEPTLAVTALAILGP